MFQVSFVSRAVLVEVLVAVRSEAVTGRLEVSNDLLKVGGLTKSGMSRVFNVVNIESMDDFSAWYRLNMSKCPGEVDCD
jgi:hypothetical protein